MENGFTIVEIKDIGKTITGKTPSSKCPEDFGKDIMFVTPSDDFNNKFIDKTIRYLSKEGGKKLKNKLLPPKSILVVCIGSTIGKIAMNKYQCITNQQINSIIPNENFDNDYVFYLLKSNIKNILQKSSKSTAVPILNKETFDKLKFKIHKSVETQKKIARVLSVIDEKIEVNKKINEKLEEMARDLYEYYFVQFDFPNENGKPYKSSGGEMVYSKELKREIPKGWEVVKLEEVIEYIKTGLNPRNHFKLGKGDYFYITIKNIAQGEINFKNADKIDDIGFEKINKRASLEAGDILFTSIEPVGLTYLLQEKPKNWNINESIFVIRPNLNFLSSEFLYFLLSSFELKSFAKHSSTGSIHKGIRHNVLKTFRFILPPKNLIRVFSNIVKPLLKQKYNNQLQIQKLESLRDFLLPMLLNGQVEVRD